MPKAARNFLIICGVSTFAFVSLFLVWLQPSVSSVQGKTPQVLENILALPKLLADSLLGTGASKQTAKPKPATPSKKVAYTEPSPEPEPEPEPEVLGVTDDDFSALGERVSRLEGSLGLGAATDSYTTAVNLIRNSSFEQNDGDAPAQWRYQLSSSTGNTFRSDEAYRSGAYGLKFQGGGSGNLGLSHPLAKTLMRRSYVLSLYIKPVNAASGASLSVGFWDEVNNRLTNAQSFNISGTKEWSRIEVKFDNTSGWSGDKWFPMIQVYDLTSGNLYIDDVQLEEGTVGSVYHYAGGGGTKDTAASLADGGLIAGTDGALHPGVNNEGSLGTPLSKFKELHLKNASIDENGGLTVNSIGGAGDANFNGDVTLGDSSSDTIVFNGRVNSHIIPEVDDTWDLGETSLEWRDLYIDGIGYIDGISLENLETITNSTDDIIAFTGVGGSDNTDLSLDLDGTYPILYSATDGNVGINDDVIVIGTTPRVTIGDAGEEDTMLVFDGNAQDFYMALDDSLDDLVIGTGSTPAANALVTIENGGEVGIGTTAPGAELHLMSTDPAIIFDTVTATDTDFWMGIIEDAGGDDDDLFVIGDGVTPGDGLTASTNEFVTIKTDGNVGIGTTAPGAELHVAGTTPRITIGDQGEEDNSLFYNGNAKQFYFTLDDSIDSMVLGQGSDSAAGAIMTWNDTGNGRVGIGNTAPGGKLEVFVGSSDGVPAVLIDQNDANQVALDINLPNAGIGDVISIDWDASSTAGGAVTGLDIDFSNFTSLNGNAVYGLHVNDLEGVSGATEYGIYVQGSNYDRGIYSESDVQVTDNIYYYAGLGNDLGLYHSGSNSYIQNITGDLYIESNVTDKDILFNVQDGGSNVELLFLDGDVSRVAIGNTAPAAEFQVGTLSGLNVDAADSVAIQGDLEVEDDVRIEGGVVTLSVATLFDLNDSSAIALDFDGLLDLDTTNDRVGIGTTAPSAPLEVAPDGGIFVGLSDDLQLTIAAAADGGLGLEDGDVQFKSNTQDANIIFTIDDGGTEKQIMYLEGDSAMVGIGTTNPTAGLDVGGGSATLATGTNSVLIAGDLEVDDDVRIDGGSIDLSAAATKVELATSTTALDFDGLLDLNTTNSRVGIGTTAPGAALDVALDAGIFVGVSDDLKLTIEAAADGGGVEVGDVRFRNATSNANIIFNVLDSATDTAVMYLEGDSGYVGIGNTNPLASLQVGTLAGLTVDAADGLAIAGDLEVEDDVRIEGGVITLSVDTAVTLSGGVDGINFDANTLSIDADNDRVGIGTNAPGAPLDVDLDGGIFVGVSDDLQLTIAASAIGGLGLEDGDIQFRNATSNANIIFSVMDSATDTQVMFLEGDSGYVGIGNTNPLASLQVGTLAGLTVDAADGLAIAGDLEVEDDVRIEGGVITLSVDTAVTLSGGVDGINFDANTLSIDADNDRVGIGTNAPVGIFDVGTGGFSSFKGVSDSEYVESTYTNYNGLVIHPHIKTGKGSIVNFIATGADSPNFTSSFSFWTRPDGGDPVETIWFDETGSIGIGTTAPRADVGIEIKLDDPAILFNTDTASDTDYWMAVIENSGGNDDDIFAIGDGVIPGDGTTANTNEFLAIQTDGNVGIGTTSPDYKLDVVGDIQFSGNIYDTGELMSIPDYVFEVDYDLPSLAELKEYVELFKHLPNVPDMDDREAWADLSLSNRDMLMLEKIEENVLYTLGQEGRLVTLEDIQEQYGQVFSVLGGVPAVLGEETVTGDPVVADDLEVLTRNEVGELTVTALVDVQGDLVVRESTKFEGELTVLADATFKGKLYLEDGAEVKGDLVIDSAIVSEFVAGESLSTGDVVYVSGSNRVNKASASSEGSLPAVGIVVGGAGEGGAVKVAIGGTVKGLSGLATGKRYFVSGGGGMTASAPEEGFVQAIGVARSGSELLVMPDLNYEAAEPPVEPPVEEPVEPAEEPVEPPVEEPVEPAEEPVEPPVEEPVEPAPSPSPTPEEPVE